MDCPKCGSACGREEAHNGVGLVCGPYGCICGWSEWPEYDLSDGQSPRYEDGIFDQYGGWIRDRHI